MKKGLFYHHSGPGRQIALSVVLCSLTAAGGALFSASARAGGQDAGMLLYRGDTRQISGITAAAYGSGVVTEDPQMHFSSTHSLRVVTHGLYQGASLTFPTPVNLTPYVGKKDAYLQFVVNITDNNATTGGLGRPGPGGGGATSSFGGAGKGGNPLGGMMGGPGGFPGMGRGQGGNVAQTTKARPIENLRVQLVSTGNQTSEFLLPLEYAKNADQWKQVAIPVAAVPGLTASSAQIKELRIFGDQPGTMNVGQIRVLTDSSPITIERIEEKFIPRNTTYTFTTRANAGQIPLKYSWDFNEADGLQEEKVGRSVRHRYSKQGDYVVTVTVSDVYGLREAKTIKFKVRVTP